MSAKRLPRGEGGVVCVGIINNSSYKENYALEMIIGESPGNNTKVLCEYTFVGIDDELVGEVLKFGYHHEGIRDIHMSNIKRHITLIFARK